MKRLVIVVLVLAVMAVPVEVSAQQLSGGSGGLFSDPLGGAILGGALGAGIGALVKHKGKRRIGEGAIIGAGLGLLLGSMSASQQAAAARNTQQQTYYPPYRQSSYYQPSSSYQVQPAYWSPTSSYSAGGSAYYQEMERQRQRTLEAELELIRWRNEELRRELATFK